MTKCFYLGQRGRLDREDGWTERSGDIEGRVGGPIQEIVEQFGQTSSSLSADSVKQTNYHSVWEQSLAGASPSPPAGPVNCFFMFFLCGLSFFFSFSPTHTSFFLTLFQQCAICLSFDVFAFLFQQDQCIHTEVWFCSFFMILAQCTEYMVITFV